MAITLSDFDNIWASSSPLTPYSFTDSNYKEGWNFIGSTPPSRQMWDFLQKNNDEKAKYIVDNYLALSGGTMTGNIILSDGGNPLSTAGGTMTGAIQRDGNFASGSADTSYLNIYGGTGYDHGAWFQLTGKDHTEAGGWRIQASDGVNRVNLLGKPDGTLTWNGKTVIVGTEVTENFSNVAVPASGTATVTLAHTPKYYSVFLSGTGFAQCSAVMVREGNALWIGNFTSVARTLTVTVKYIY